MWHINRYQHFCFFSSYMQNFIKSMCTTCTCKKIKYGFKYEVFRGVVRQILLDEGSSLQNNSEERRELIVQVDTQRKRKRCMRSRESNIRFPQPNLLNALYSVMLKKIKKKINIQIYFLNSTVISGKIVIINFHKLRKYESGKVIAVNYKIVYDHVQTPVGSSS